MKYFAKTATSPTINEEDIAGMDIIKIAPDHYHLIQDNTSYEIEVLSTSNKKVLLSINGEHQEVLIEDEYDQLVDQLGMTKVAFTKVSNINAPMPGLVLDIMVREGDAINAGDPLIILEAMKMENILKSAGEGVIKHISVKQGEAVDKGQLLIELE